MVTQRFLLDSHVLVWLLYEPERIGARTKKLIGEAEVVYISSVSFWELTLKHNMGKLKYTPQALIEGAAAAGLEVLPLEPEHCLRLQKIELPRHGLSDPFDAMLLVQALAEQCTLLTADGSVLAGKHNVRDVRS